MNRKQFIKKSILGTIGLGLTSGLYAWQIEPFFLEFVHKRMPVKNLPDELVGKTVMQISDLHIGNRFDYHYIIDSLIKAKTFHPDFVVYTGDYVTYENEKQFRQLKEVLNHVVKGNLGTAAVLGNHDYGINWSQQFVADEITQLLSNSGVTVLRNEQKNFYGLTFLGLDDYWGLNFRPKKVLKQLDTSKATIALCHNPDVCDKPMWKPYQGWILSGHTHGGQVKPPFLDPPILPVKNKLYTAGEIDLKDGRTLYINRALGHLWQVRMNVRPEITLFALEKA
ncbi:metallophosphoesterase [bacterium]|nr:MAG: metallophosphoesterase [bacterium]